MVPIYSILQAVNDKMRIILKHNIIILYRRVSRYLNGIICRRRIREYTSKPIKKKAFLLYSEIVSICWCDGGSARDTFIIYLSVVSSLCQVILLCTSRENFRVY